MTENKPIHSDWKLLAASYQDLSSKKCEFNAAREAIGHLCKSISESHLRDGLFAHMSPLSFWDLNISQTATTYPLHDTMQWLVISPQQNGAVKFSLKYSLRRQEEQWSRNVDHTQVLAHFNKFLRQLGWNYYPIADTAAPPPNGHYVQRFLRKLGWRI